MDATFEGAEIHRQVVEAINRLDFTPLYRQIGEHMVRSIDTNFRQGGRYGSIVAGEWTGGSTKWVMSWRAERDQGQTLIDTGRLVASITYTAGPNGVTIGTNVEYGIKHQYGLGTLARPFLVIQAEDVTAIQELTAKFVSKALGGRLVA